MQIYERLLRTNDIDRIYEDIGMSNDEKYKKAKVAKSIWSDASESTEVVIKPELSACVFEQLFPEIRESANIIATMPSKKSLDRIGVVSSDNVPVPHPLDGTTMHLKSNLDRQIIRNLTEISRCFVTGVKHLALVGTLSSDFERQITDERHLEAIETPKYLLVHRFVNSSNNP